MIFLKEIRHCIAPGIKKEIAHLYLLKRQKKRT